MALTIPLITPEQIDYWGWFMWLKFMKMAGGRDVLNEGKHTISIEVRPYLHLDELHIGELLAKGSIDVDVNEIDVDKKLISIQPIQPNSG